MIYENLKNLDSKFLCFFGFLRASGTLARGGLGAQQPRYRGEVVPHPILAKNEKHKIPQIIKIKTINKPGEKNATINYTK